VVSIAREYTDQLGSAKIVSLMETSNCWPGVYIYLGGRLATSEVRKNEIRVPGWALGDIKGKEE
jgi:hypothetical protein